MYQFDGNNITLRNTIYPLDARYLHFLIILLLSLYSLKQYIEPVMEIIEEIMIYTTAPAGLSPSL